MAFNRNWNTVIGAWDAAQGTWDFAEDTGADTLSLGVSEGVSLLVGFAQTTSINLSLTEETDIAVSVGVSSVDTGTVSLTEIAGVDVMLESSDSSQFGLAETAEDMFVDLLSGTELTLVSFEETAIEIEDWPGQNPSAEVAWGKSSAASAVWTKVSAAQPSPWG